MKITALLFWLGASIVLWVITPMVFVSINGALGLPVYIFGMFRLIGIIFVILGIIIALIASLTFMKFGKGTPAIIDPPKKLVIKGLYKRTRNPIYVAHLLIFLGLFIFWGHVMLFALFVIGFIGFHLYILKTEEPVLEKRYREDYLKYMKVVPRWLW